MDTARLTNQPRLTLTPLGVPTFRMVCLTTTFLTWMMLPGREKASISSPLIGVNRLIKIISRHIIPQNREHRVCPITKNESQDLAYQARNRNPNPKRRGHLDANFVNFDDISLGGGYQSDLSLANLLLYISSVFFRMFRIVKRETLSALAIPRWEILSWRLATMLASFWGVMALLLGLRAKVLPHSWHRQRELPLSLRPNLMQSVLWQ